MFFLNLSAAEFLTLLGTLSGLVTALYLLDRAKRRKIVSTLHFWAHAQVAEVRQARRRMREPWSLILQLSSLVLLLLAVSRVQWGNRDRRGRDHVLLLDTSSWAAAQAAGGGPQTVLDREKNEAARYLSLLPPTDRVMVVVADGLATPLTSFTSDRRQLRAALADAHPGFLALKIDGALSFARQALSFSGGQAGEIVYLGPEMIEPQNAQENKAAGSSRDVRTIPVEADRENCGIRQVTARQSETEPDLWRAFVRIRNFGREPHTIRLRSAFGGTAFAARRVLLAPGEDNVAEYAFTTADSGQFVVSIDPGGSLRSDDRVSLFLPRTDPIRVTIYTDRPVQLRPLVAANRQLIATFLRTSQYTSKPAANVMVLDRFAPSVSPEIPALWIDPPKDHSPLPVKGIVSDSLITWTADSALESALRAKQLRVPEANTFQTFEGDTALASVREGAVVVLRAPNQPHTKNAVVGFDPAEGQLRYEVATPLLFANLFEWLDPVAFRSINISSGQVGSAAVPLDKTEGSKTLQVIDDQGFAIPFSRRANELQIFVDHPATVHITSAEREQIVSLRLPAVASRRWEPPAGSPIGLSAAMWFSRPAIDLWKWLAILGAAGLLLEWFLFGPRRRSSRKATRTAGLRQDTSIRDRERELIAR